MGRVWRIDAVRDHSALLGVAGDLTEFPFGLLLWESSLALADRLGTETGKLNGAETLEIGAGAGLAGLAAAAAGARVVQTDHSAEAIALCRRNADLNRIDGVSLAQSDWRDWHDARRYDLIIGADVLYERETHTLVREILSRNLAPSGRAILADPRRLDTPAFLASLRAEGWHIGMESLEVPAIVPVRPGQSVTIDLFTIRNPRTPVSPRTA